MAEVIAVAGDQLFDEEVLSVSLPSSKVVYCGSAFELKQLHKKNKVDLLLCQSKSDIDFLQYHKMVPGAAKLLVFETENISWLETEMERGYDDEIAYQDSDLYESILLNKCKRLLAQHFQQDMYNVFSATLSAYPFPLAICRKRENDMCRLVLANKSFQTHISQVEINDCFDPYAHFEIDAEKHQRSDGPGFIIDNINSAADKSSARFLTVVIPINLTRESTVAYDFCVCFDTKASNMGENDALVKELKTKLNDQEDNLAAVAHDLRKPINNMVGLIPMLEDESTQKAAKKGIKQCSEKAQSLLNDLLSMSRLNSGKIVLEPESFNIRDFVEGIYMQYRASADEKNLKFNVSVSDNIPLNIHGDKRHLGQILDNLLSNAFKFTPNGRVDLVIEKDFQNDEEVGLIFTIEDSGIGIKKEDLERIFESYAQSGEGEKIQYQGSGLGLAICKRLVSQLNGEINVNSEPGVGSKFTFNLTFNTPSLQKEEKSKKLKADALVNTRALIVDDNEVTLHVLESLLKRWKVKVETATTAEKAISLYEQQASDMILMDIQLPSMDGISASKVIRQMAKEQKLDVKIIGLSAFIVNSETKQTSSKVLDDLLSKPVNSAELQFKMLQLLSTDTDSKRPQDTQKMKYEVIEEEKIRKFANGDPEFMKQLIEIFLKRTPEYMNDLNKAIDQKNWSDIKTLAHKVKPTFTYVGMEKFTTKVGSIEDYAIKKDMDTIHQIMDDVWGDCQRAFREFKHMYDHLE